jgi:uncharacterized Tic20 family protein
MDDQDHITVDENETPDAEENEGVPIPSRIRAAVDDVRDRIQDTPDRDVVEEYEERYHGRRRLEATPVREESGAKEETGAKDVRQKGPIYMPRGKTKRIYDPVSVSDNERKWATIAHGSTLLTVLLGILSGGALVLLTIFVPLLIYFSFRKRSEFVAFHALQAFTIQLVGTIGWVALIVVGVIAWAALIIVSAILIVVLVGIILLPLVLFAGPVFFVVSLALPLGTVIYSFIAMTETHAGRNYRIPYISDWVESQMYSNLFTIL